MTVQVKLTDIVDGMESQSFDNCVFINQDTGKIVFILHEFLSKAEDGESGHHMIEWQQEMMLLAHEIIEHEDLYIQLPGEYEINEYDMMEKFCFTVADPEKEKILFRAIQGKGAFRRFKDLIVILDLTENWYNYRDAAYIQVAKDFCKRHGFSYTTD